MDQDIQLVITSRGPERLTPKQFAKALRGHWSIENCLHYLRDVTLGEDHSTARTGYSQQNLATLRNLVVGLSVLWAYRQQGRRKYLPDFRRQAQNHRLTLIQLITRPLFEVSAQ
jgi:hypothetical protein